MRNGLTRLECAFGARAIPATSAFSGLMSRKKRQARQ